MKDKEELIRNEKDNPEITKKKADNQEEYPGSMYEDVVFSTGPLAKQIMVNTESIREIRKQMVENVKANPENATFENGKQPVEKAEPVKKKLDEEEYPGAMYEDVVFSTGPLAKQIMVNTESIREIRKQMVENVKANPENATFEDRKQPVEKAEPVKKKLDEEEYPGAVLEDVVISSDYLEKKFVVNTNSIREIRKEMVENVKAKPEAEVFEAVKQPVEKSEPVKKSLDDPNYYPTAEVDDVTIRTGYLDEDLVVSTRSVKEIAQEMVANVRGTVDDPFAAVKKDPKDPEKKI